MSVALILNNKGRNIISAHSDDSLQDIAETLSGNKIGAVMVLDKNENPKGIISERDIVRQIARDGAKALSMPASKCMTVKIISCEESETIDQAMEKMTTGRFRHLPVMKDGQLVGIISIGDVVKLKIEMAERDAEDLKRYIAS